MACYLSCLPFPAHFSFFSGKKNSLAVGFSWRKVIWLVVSTHLKKLKNISKSGSFPQIGMNIKNISNHHPDHFLVPRIPANSSIKCIRVSKPTCKTPKDQTSVAEIQNTSMVGERATSLLMFRTYINDESQIIETK